MVTLRIKMDLPPNNNCRLQPGLTTLQNKIPKFNLKRAVIGWPAARRLDSTLLLAFRDARLIIYFDNNKIM